MSFHFRPAVRENVSLIIGVCGGTGSGKTMSAMRMAQGIVGRDGTFAVIDTEQGRAKHYAPKPGEEPNFINTFRFDHAELHEPFRPDAYSEAITEADKAGYKVIVCDSMSHEHAGSGGLLDWHEEELDRLAGTDWKKREACNMLAWAKVKLSHKKMVQRLLQVRAHLVLCFRAEEKIDIIREDGKTKIVPKKSATGLDGWVPISEKNLPYELTASFLLMAQRPGIPLPIKLQNQHKELFPLDKPITEESGRAIAAWAAGGKKAEATQVPAQAKSAEPSDVQHHQPAPASAHITADQSIELADLFAENRWDKAKFLAKHGIKSLEELTPEQYAQVKATV